MIAHMRIASASGSSSSPGSSGPVEDSDRVVESAVAQASVPLPDVMSAVAIDDVLEAASVVLSVVTSVDVADEGESPAQAKAMDAQSGIALTASFAVAIEPIVCARSERRA